MRERRARLPGATRRQRCQLAAHTPGLASIHPLQLAGAGANPDKLGVAAALWDGALVLAGYLAAQPSFQYLGERRRETGWLELRAVGRLQQQSHPAAVRAHRRLAAPAANPAAAGMRCVELGAGVGLVGLALAAMGARVAVTDVAKVLPLMRANLAANGYDPARG